MERIDQSQQICRFGLSCRQRLAGQCDRIHQNQDQSQINEPPRRGRGMHYHHNRGGAMINNDGVSIVNNNEEQTPDLNQDHQNNHRGRGGDHHRGRGGDHHRGRGGDHHRGRGGENHRGRGNDNHRGVRGGYQNIQEDGDHDTIQENDQIRGGSSYQGRGANGGRGNYNRGGNYRGRGRGDVGTFTRNANNVETTSNNQSNQPQETNQRRARCNHGKSCWKFAQGNCKFFHSPSHSQARQNSDAQSSGGREQCDLGYACDDEECRNIKWHPNEDDISETQSDNQSQKSSTQQKCSLDKLCQNELCIFIHSTSTGRSLKFELMKELMTPGYPQHNPMPFQTNSRQPPQRRPAQQEEEKKYYKEEEKKNEKKTYKFKDFLKQKLNVQKQLHELKKIFPNQILSFDLEKKDEIIFEYDSSTEKWVEADQAVQKYMLQRIKHIVKSTSKNDVEHMTNLFTGQKRQEINQIGATSVWIQHDQVEESKNNKWKKMNHRNNQNTISIYGFRIDNDKLMKIKKILEQYQFLTYKMDYAIFNKVRDISENLVHVFHYLKNNQIIEDILKDSQPPIQQNVNYDSKFLQIKVKITLSQYKDIINKVKTAVQNIQTKKFRISNYFIVTQTRLPNDKTIQKILEDKFDIKISDIVQIFEMNDSQHSQFSNRNNNQNNNKNNQRQGKKGWRYDRIDERQKKLYEMKDYEIQLTGPDLDQAEQFLMNKLSQINCQKVTLNQTNNRAIERKAKDLLQQVQQEYGVLIWFDFPTIYSVGKKNNNRLQDALRKFVDLEMEDQKARQRSTKQIIMQDAPNAFLVKILDDNKAKLQQIESKYRVRVTYNKNWFYISGSQQDCENAGQEISIIQIQLCQDIINKQIIDKDLLKAMHMKGIKQCENDFGVYITSETVEEQQQRQRSLINQINHGIVVKSQTEDYQWFYAVRPSDANYYQRPNKNEDWFPLDPDQNRQVEGHYKSCCQKNLFGQKLEIVGDQDMQQNGFHYEVWGTSHNPSTWYEKNTRYNNPRQLRRNDVQAQIKQSSYVNPNMLHSDRMDQNNQQNNPIQKKVWSVKGKKLDVQRFEEAMKKFVNDPTNHKSVINLRHYDKCQGKINSVLFNELKQIAQIKFNTQAIFNGDGTQITLQGLKCKEAQVIIEKILKFANEYNVPDHWEQFDKMIDQYLLVLDVQQGTNAWNVIYNQFRQTMPNAQILKIQRIQNKKLWRTFTIHQEDITDKHGKQANQFMLYHGTRATPPIAIYDSEEGFNMLYSSGGMWGQACYFAEKASYSHNGYKHPVGDGTFQMFYARVTVGEFKKLDPLNTLKMPPPMESKPKLLYDSVQGETNGSSVYMIYQNKKAYPEYLITYK
ncbi:poly adp-ribose polymerase member 14-like protein [Stylonychia lemnae]|uniref:Poly [ADP-ribose] polymerase n=1 Tax=Stylonychia lemnae TaxID=5949 RepID=A0A078AXK8_STYLE|nr:poly adp-ribose polymerase member 14-like protein [Stylonychia lemnae]|eukprot:CDW86806.1 poly adp-ribose polymerase member 14-like protein [Stylonychia lemnae]